MTDSKAIPPGYDIPIPSSAIVRLYGPLEPRFDQTWEPEDIEPFA
jgi:hypothetical protein